MEITKNNFDEEVLNAEGLVLVDFYADWCAPCMMLKQSLVEIEEFHKIKICKINVDNEPELAIKFGVSSIPHVLFYKDGKKVDSFLGYRPTAEIETIIEKIGE
jgi:thioredoxin 1